MVCISVFYDKTSGVLQYAEKTSSGSYGGCVGLKDGRALVQHGSEWRPFVWYTHLLPEGNSWSKSTNEQNYAPNDQPNGSQIAVGADGKAYILCLNLGARISTNETKALVYCYDTKKTTEGNVSAPEWYTAVKGENKQTGYGLVVDGNGVVYVATDKYITAISSTGSVLWATEVAGTAYGVPAVDNEGYIYYNDTEKGSLVKLEPATGKAIASLQLGTGLKSSPTISADGIIYVTGMLEGKPTLFAVEAQRQVMQPMRGRRWAVIRVRADICISFFYPYRLLVSMFSFFSSERVLPCSDEKRLDMHS